MKTRIIGSLLILIVLGGLFLVTNQDTQPTQQSAPAPMNNESSFKSLSVN
jgi:hypothetical protein